MKKASFSILLVLAGVGITNCNFQTLNSTSGDSELFSPGVAIDTSTANGARFAAAQAIFKARCGSCHAAFSAYTEQQWSSYGYVVAGSATESTVFKKIAGAVAGSGGNMPLGETLSSENIATLKDWIDQMVIDPGTSTPGTTTAAQRTTAALAVLANSCASCHGSTRTATSSSYSGSTVPAFTVSANFSSDSDFVTAGLVVVGSSSSSWLYRSLKSYGNINTMPKGGSAISSSSAKAIKDWIDGMGTP